jgi:hypothetical protein
VASWSPDVRFGALPPRLRAAVDAALVDLQRPTAIDVQLGYDADNGTLYASEKGELGRAGIRPPENLEGAPLVGELADWLQTQFFLESRGAWAQARPKCPGHSHPAEAIQIGDEAWWVRPPTKRPLGRIGRLYAHGTYSSTE